MSAGYGFVPLPDQIRRIPREQGHDRRLPDHYFGWVELTYVCAQPLHVGSGFKRLDGGKVLRGMVRSGETPVLPGSSFKGALRARYEAITRSCALWEPANNGNQKRVLSRSYPEIKEAQVDPKALRLLELGRRQQCAGDRVCPACGLFGCQSGGYARRSRVSVGDLLPLSSLETSREDLPPQFTPRLHHCGSFDAWGGKFQVSKLHGRKFHVGQGPEAPGDRQGVEALPPQTVLSGRLRLFNLSEAELGGLLVACGIEPPLPLKVGAGKGLGMGRLVPQEISWDVRDHRRRPVEESFIDTCVRTFFDSDDAWVPGYEMLKALHEGEM